MPVVPWAILYRGYFMDTGVLVRYPWLVWLKSAAKLHKHKKSSYVHISCIVL